MLALPKSSEGGGLKRENTKVLHFFNSNYHNLVTNL